MIITILQLGIVHCRPNSKWLASPPHRYHRFHTENNQEDRHRRIIRKLDSPAYGYVLGRSEKARSWPRCHIRLYSEDVSPVSTFSHPFYRIVFLPFTKVSDRIPMIPSWNMEMVAFATSVFGINCTRLHWLLWTRAVQSQWVWSRTM